MKKWIVIFMIFACTLSLNAEEKVNYLVPGTAVEMNGFIHEFEITQARVNTKNELVIIIKAKKTEPGESPSGLCQTPSLRLKLSKKPDAILYYIWDEDFKFNRSSKGLYKTLSSQKALNFLSKQGKLVWTNKKEQGFKVHAKLHGKGIHAHIESSHAFEGQKVQKLMVESMAKTSISIHAEGIEEGESHRIYLFRYDDSGLKTSMTIFFNNVEGTMPRLPEMQDIKLQSIAYYKVYLIVTGLEAFVEKCGTLLERAGEQEAEHEIKEEYILALLQYWFSHHPQDVVKH